MVSIVHIDFVYPALSALPLYPLYKPIIKQAPKLSACYNCLVTEYKSVCRLYVVVFDKLVRPSFKVYVFVCF